jgi:hypothetical protein
MRSPHHIAIALLCISSASFSVLAPALSGTVATAGDTHAVPDTIHVAGTSEPPGPGCPSIPGGPGPLPDDDDDDDAEFSA